VLKHITIKNYKNLVIDTEFDNRIVLIIGENGIGKTNILESIYYLCNGNQFRSSDYSSIAYGSDLNSFNLSGEFTLNNGATQIQKSISYFEKDEEKKKKFEINDKSTNLSIFSKNTHAIIFAPNSIDLISDGPEIRRNEFDDILSKISDKNKKIINDYKLTLKSRNAFLKSSQKKLSFSEAHTDKFYNFWNERLMLTAIPLFEARMNLLNELNESLFTFKDIFHYEENNVRLSYISKMDIADYSNSLKHKLGNNHVKELVNGITLYGPHRDDYGFYFNEKNIKEYGSRGQQRIATFIIKLAEINIFDKYLDRFHNTIILLLDDLPSELDEKHINNIEEIILKINHQVFLTSTSSNFSKELLGRAKIIEL